ncbi:MAG: hypothetical protein K0R92_1503 [Lachnospiraceae bacterium]|jgi:hypothetical protein|nr:hypothetical protein [Lachnospiraceae bacterium]
MILVEKQRGIKRKFLLLYNQLLLLVILAGLVLFPVTRADAASASITFGTKTPAVTVGEEIIVSISLSSANPLGGFEAYITYNPQVLEFEGEASFIAGGDGLIKISDVNATDNKTTRKYIIKFIGKELGSSEVEFREKAIVYDYETGEEMSVSTNAININVGAKAAASANTNLAELKIIPNNLKPEFSTDLSEYTAEVTNDTKQLIISAIPEDKASTVTIVGNDALNIGSNTVTVTVKAESGHTKRYTILVNRLAGTETEEETKTSPTTEETEETIPQAGEQGETVTPTTADFFQITKEGDAIYFERELRFQITELPEEELIPTGYSKSTILIDETAMEVLVPSENTESEFVLLYAKSEDGTSRFYQFDKIENTLQRFNEEQNVNNNIDEKNQGNIIILIVIVIIFTIVTIVMTSFVIRIYLQKINM